MSFPDCDGLFRRIDLTGPDGLSQEEFAHLSSCAACAARFEHEIFTPLSREIRMEPPSTPLPRFPRETLERAREQEVRRLLPRLLAWFTHAPLLRPALAMLLLFALVSPVLRFAPEPRLPDQAPREIVFVERLLPEEEVFWIDSLLPELAHEESLAALFPPETFRSSERDWPDSLCPAQSDAFAEDDLRTLNSRTWNFEM